MVDMLFGRTLESLMSKFASFFALLLLAAVLCGERRVGAQAQGEPNSPQQSTTRPRRTGEASEQQQRPSAPTTQPSPQQGRPEETLPQDEDVERFTTDLTNILFTAIDKNKHFVTTLQQGDIRILEDNTPQQIFTFQRQTDLPLSLAILIDTSASQERTLPEEKAAARIFIDSVLRPNKDEAAVLSFTGEATLEQVLTGSVARVRRAIDRIEFVPPSGYIGGGITALGTPPISGTNQTLAGSTAIWDALWVTSEEVLSQTPERTRRAIILLSDGVNTSGQLEMKQAVDRALKNDVVIYSIGIGDSFNYDGVDEGALRKVSERTGGRAFFPRNETELRAAFAQLEQELRSQYLIAYSPTNKRRDNTFRQVRIEVINPELRKEKLRLTYRQGYFAKGAAPAAPNKASKGR